MGTVSSVETPEQKQAREQRERVDHLISLAYTTLRYACSAAAVLVILYFLYRYFKNKKIQLQRKEDAHREQQKTHQEQQLRREEDARAKYETQRRIEQHQRQEAVAQHRRQLMILERQREEQRKRELAELNRFIPIHGRPLVLHGVATFRSPKKRRWTSHQAAASFEGEHNRATGEIRASITRYYEQASRNDPSDKAQPQFGYDEIQKMMDYALRVFRDRVNGTRRNRPDRRNDTEPPEFDEDKAHEQDLCERCQELGHNCTRRLVYN